SNNVFCFNYNENRNGILCVGRFEPIKNQLSVCKALLNTELNLILIGAAHAHNKDYLKKIQKVNAVNNNIHIITKNIEQYELNSYYNKCRVHVLASFRESPGLSSLEALATGANIVVSSSQFCPIDTYFKEIIGKHVFLCNPYSISSIRKAIEDAYNAPLMRKSINRFSWDLTAKQTYLAYQEIINNRD
ncbi:glycosyltransferase, partial [Escherichia coli]